MALFKINSGNEEDLFKYEIDKNTQQEKLVVPFNPGWAYFSPDTGNFFIDSPLKDKTTLTKDNLKEYRIQLNAGNLHQTVTTLDKNNNEISTTYVIAPEFGVLQTNPIEQVDGVLNEGEYVSKSDLNAALSKYLLNSDLPSQLSNYVAKSGNSEVSGAIKINNTPIEYTGNNTPISDTERYYRPILVSTSEPTDDQGQNGDIWVIIEGD